MSTTNNGSLDAMAVAVSPQSHNCDAGSWCPACNYNIAVSCGSCNYNFGCPLSASHNKSQLGSRQEVGSHVRSLVNNRGSPHLTTATRIVGTAVTKQSSRRASCFRIVLLSNGNSTPNCWRNPRINFIYSPTGDEMMFAGPLALVLLLTVFEEALKIFF